MPIYEYECPKCGRRTEVLERLDANPKGEPIDCPTEGCDGMAHRVLSVPGGLQFKGSGWYVTDYGNKGGGKANGGDKSKGEGSGESKGSGEKTSGGCGPGCACSE